MQTQPKWITKAKQEFHDIWLCKIYIGFSVSQILHNYSFSYSLGVLVNNLQPLIIWFLLLSVHKNIEARRLTFTYQLYGQMSVTTKLGLCLMEDLKFTQYLHNKIWSSDLLLYYSEWGSQTADRGIPAFLDKNAVILKKSNSRKRQMALTLVPCLHASTSLPIPTPPTPFTTEAPFHNAPT